jgi:hypothetical protein
MQRIYVETHQQANIISYTGFIAMRDPHIADKLYSRTEKKKLMYREKQTYFWGERIYDLRGEWFRKLENKQHPELSPRNRRHQIPFVTGSEERRGVSSS